MDHLWTPWRMAYLQGDAQPAADCLFCERIAQKDDSENLILHRGRRAFIILNRYPYNNGHLMIVPYAHQPSLETLDADTLAEMMALSQDSLKLLRQAYAAEAFNLGINIGTAAGAGVADHIHLHVVPRWAGDTNYMATVAQTRVIPEWVQDTYRKLKAVWAELKEST